MASSDSRINLFKLETTFHDNHVINTTYVTDLATRQRKVSVKTKWIAKERFDTEGLGIVTLEENEGGQLRVVKSRIKGIRRMSPIDELETMVKSRDVCFHEMPKISSIGADGRGYQYQHLFVLLFGWYEDQNFTFIATEYVEHGDLGQHLRTQGPRFNAKEISRQLLEGLAVLHEMGAYHGALSPKKVLIASIQPIWVKITGLGRSKDRRAIRFRTRVESTNYLAPEVLGLLPSKHQAPTHPHSIDMWSFGCIVHEILTSQVPFLETSFNFGYDSELELDSSYFTPEMNMYAFDDFCQSGIDFPVEILQQAQVSENEIAFIKSLLVAIPSSRTSAKEALRSPWLLEDDTEIDENDANYRGRLVDLRKGIEDLEEYLITFPDTKILLVPTQNTVITANESYSNPHKLKTIVHNDYVIETTYDPVTKVASSAKWVEKKWLGSGGYGIVTLQEKEGGGQLRAVKKVSREVGKANRSQELEALSKLMDCPRDLFLQFFGWYESEYFTFIVTEYIEHGDLSQYFKSNPEAKSNAKEINRQLLEGLAILHEKKICHRDLKPQNILIASPKPIRVKIADFGGSKHEENTRLETRIGTPSYCAPEILGLLPFKGTRYTNAVDMWALGCLAHETLTLQIPFLEPTDTCYDGQATSGILTDQPSPQMSMAFLLNFCLGRIGFPVEILQQSQVSKHGIDFVKSLLVADPGSRLSAIDALQSPWFTEDN